MAKGALDLGAVYMFLKRLVTPFEKWDAFEAGVIDKDGKVIIPKDKRTMDQDRSFGYFDRLVGNLKKLLAKVPGGRTRLASFAAALLLIREENIDPDNIPALSERLDHYMTEAETLSENMSAGSGAIAGIGVGDDGEPGVSPEAMKKRKRKKKKPEDGRVIISFEDHTRKE